LRSSTTSSRASSLDTIRGVADALRPVISALVTLGSEAGYQPEEAGLYALFLGAGSSCVWRTYAMRTT
jgi:hypothetical protein